MYHNNPAKLKKDLEAGYKILEEYNKRVEGEYFFLGRESYRLSIDNIHLKMWLSVIKDYLKES